MAHLDVTQQYALTFGADGCLRSWVWNVCIHSKVGFYLLMA